MFKLRFRRNRIKCWASRYSYSQGYAEAVAVGRTARKRGYLTKNELIQFFDWKTGGRGRSRCLKNTRAYVKEVTRTSFSTSNARLQIEVLALLDGVDLRVASAILHLVFPRKYPIMDYRALWSLGIKKPKYNFELWDSYCNYCKKTAQENHVGLRTLDRALWQFSKEREE